MQIRDHWTIASDYNDLKPIGLSREKAAKKNFWGPEESLSGTVNDGLQKTVSKIN